MSRACVLLKLKTSKESVRVFICNAKATAEKEMLCWK